MPSTEETSLLNLFGRNDQINISHFYLILHFSEIDLKDIIILAIRSITLHFDNIENHHKLKIFIYGYTNHLHKKCHFVK